jgi:hypothetical protein
MVLEGGTLGSIDPDTLDEMTGGRGPRLSPFSPPHESPLGNGQDEAGETTWAFIPRRPTISPAKKMMQSSPLSPPLPMRTTSSSFRPSSPGMPSGSQSASLRTKPLPPPLVPTSSFQHARHTSSASSSPSDTISPSSAHFMPRRKVRCDSISTPSFSATLNSSYLPHPARSGGSPVASSSRLPPPSADIQTGPSEHSHEAAKSALLPHYSLDAKFSLPQGSEPIDLESLIGGIENLGPSLKRSLGEAMMHSKKPGSSSKIGGKDGLPHTRLGDSEETEESAGKGTGRKVSLGLGLFKESSTSHKDKERKEKDKLKDSDKDRAGGPPLDESKENEPVRARSRGLTLLDIAEGLSPQARKTSLPSTSPQEPGLPSSSTSKSPPRPGPQRRSSHRSRRPTLVASSSKQLSFAEPIAGPSSPSLLSPRLPASPLSGHRPPLPSTQTGLSDLTFVPVSPAASAAATVHGGPFSPFLSSRVPSPATEDGFELPVQVPSSSEEDDWTDSYGSSSFDSSTGDEDESDSSAGGLGSSFLGGHGLGTSPRGTVRGADEDSGEEDSEDESHLPTIPLMPFRNQVGGHSAIYKFTKRAVCKVSLFGSPNEFPPHH